jgi:RNA polymerase sigma-70 factor (ECF subfamily)
MTARIIGRAAAEDVVQETSTRAWTHAPSWRQSGGRYSYAAWLSRVAMNLAIDQTRRSVKSVDIDSCDALDPTPDVETALIRRERMALLKDAIAQLT